MSGFLLELEEVHSALRALAGHAGGSVQFIPGEDMHVVTRDSLSTMVAIARVSILERADGDGDVFELAASDIARVLAVFKLPKRDDRWMARLWVGHEGGNIGMPDVEPEDLDAGTLTFTEAWHEEVKNPQTPKVLQIPAALPSMPPVRAVMRLALQAAPYDGGQDRILTADQSKALAAASRAFGQASYMRSVQAARHELMVASVGARFLGVYVAARPYVLDDGRIVSDEWRDLWMSDFGLVDVAASVEAFLRTIDLNDIEATGTDDAAPADGAMPGQEAFDLEADSDEEPEGDDDE